MSSQFAIIADIYERTLQICAMDQTRVIRDEIRETLERARDQFRQCDVVLKEALQHCGEFISILEQRNLLHETRLQEIENSDPFPAIDEQLSRAQDIHRKHKIIYSIGKDKSVIPPFVELAQKSGETNALMKMYLKRQQIDKEKHRYISYEMPLYEFLLLISELLRTLSSVDLEQLIQWEYLKGEFLSKVRECKDTFARGKTIPERIRDTVQLALEVPFDLVSILPELLRLQKQFSLRDYTSDKALNLLKRLASIAHRYLTLLDTISKSLSKLNNTLNSANNSIQSTS